MELSPKSEANKPLSTHFSTIGESYDTTGDTGITSRPKYAIVDKFTAVNKEARALVGKFIPLQTA